jgi:DnaK suppressor protein
MVENARSVGVLTHPPVDSRRIPSRASDDRVACGLLFVKHGGRGMRTEDKIRKQLERELSRVNHAVAVLKKEPRAEELEGFGDNTPLSEEFDAMLATEDTELRTALLSRYLDRAAALDEARHRLDSGTYGICVACGKGISAKRLSAIPEALHCTPCQEEFEKRRTTEIHAHEWKRAAETLRERTAIEGPEPKALTEEGR